MYGSEAFTFIKMHLHDPKVVYFSLGPPCRFISSPEELENQPEYVKTNFVFNTVL